MAESPVPARLKSFEQAFQDHSGSCRGDCECGRVFYNPDGGWTWEEGEIEALGKQGATSLPWSIGYVCFEGRRYVVDCECWHERARKIADWLSAHDEAIAAYLTEEKKRKQAEAQRSPTVEA